MMYNRVTCAVFSGGVGCPEVQSRLREAVQAAAHFGLHEDCALGELLVRVLRGRLPRLCEDTAQLKAGAKCTER